MRKIKIKSTDKRLNGDPEVRKYLEKIEDFVNWKFSDIPEEIETDLMIYGTQIVCVPNDIKKKAFLIDER